MYFFISSPKCPSPNLLRVVLCLSQGAIFVEGVTVKGVTQLTTQPKLAEIQRKCQEFAEWEK